MIVIQARIPVNSDRRNVAYQHIHDFVDAARAENGCLRCDAFISLEDPDSILIHQAWRDAGDLDRHASGRALDAFLTALPEFVEGQVITTRYDTVTGQAANDDDDSVELDADVAPAAQGAPTGVTLH
jgi:quinol monooxygenase YgiN